MMEWLDFLDLFEIWIQVSASFIHRNMALAVLTYALAHNGARPSESTVLNQI